MAYKMFMYQLTSLKGYLINDRGWQTTSPLRPAKAHKKVGHNGTDIVEDASQKSEGGVEKTC